MDVTVLADGRFVMGGSHYPSDHPYGTVSASDADDGFPIDGPLLALEVDDGRASDLLLTVPEESCEIIALDARTGERVWSAAATPRTEALVPTDLGSRESTLTARRRSGPVTSPGVGQFSILCVVVAATEKAIVRRVRGSPGPWCMVQSSAVVARRLSPRPRRRARR